MLSLFLTVKLAHLLFAGASLVLFALRGSLAVIAGRPLSARVWKVLPHVVDTLLLGWGVWLAVLLRLDPLRVPWLGVKLLCVAGYIVLGVLAFRLGGPRWLRIGLFAAALLLFGFIVSIAVLHDPRGILVLLG